MEASEEDRLPEEELIGQMSYVANGSPSCPRRVSLTRSRTLTFAAMDTTSNALSLTLWRLAQSPAAQEKLRQEIFEAQEACIGGDIGFDDLVGLPYMDAVCRETLRL